jgi:protein-S-isoprenylcysteine O-methyltransferase Ste14
MSFDQPLPGYTHTDVHTLELKIPPLGLVLVAALVMWMGASYFPTLNFRFPLQIKPEERALTLIFGEEFKAYCVEVGRWI